MTQANDELLPRDVQGKTIQALGVDEDTHVAVAATAASVQGVLEPTAEVIEVVCSIPVHMKFGNSSVSVTTGDRLVLPGSYIYKILPDDNQTHVAVIRAASESADGVVSITKMR